MENGNCTDVEVSFDKKSNCYVISWISGVNEAANIFKTTTTDFKSYTKTTEGTRSDRLNNRVNVEIEGEQQTGTVHKISWKIIDGLIKHYEWFQYHDQQRAENTGDDPERFKSLKPIDATITLNPSGEKEISDMLIGIFFEDINYPADGGLYAELIQNRDFEYSLSDKKGRDKSWDSKKAWRTTGNEFLFTIDSVNPIHPNNKHYAVIETTNTEELTKGGLINEGFDGIAVKSGEKYDFSVFAKILDGKSCNLLFSLLIKTGKQLAQQKRKKQEISGQS